MDVLGISLGISIPLALLIGGIIGYFIAMKVFKKQLKKNPPINEEQIRMMYKQMGRTPTEKQIKQIMATFRKNAK